MEKYDLTTSEDGIQRSQERIKKGGEVFTPSVIIEQMMDMVSDQTIWSDPLKTFLDPTCGNGNILIGMLKRRLANGVSAKDAVSTLYGVELMQDNVDLARKRIAETIGTHEYDDIIEHNIVCANFFDWNFDPDDWRLKTEIEKKEDKIIEKKGKMQSPTSKSLF